MTPAPISVERLRELLALATALPWEADAGTVRPAPESPDRVTIAYCSGEGSPQGEADAELIAAAINALPALLRQLAERDAEVALLRARETDLQNALYRWLPHITPFSPEIQGDDCNLLIGLMEPVGPELGESIRQRAIAAERARKECVRLAEKWERISSTHGVRCFTGDDHLIFANELRVAIGQQPAAASVGDRE